MREHSFSITKKQYDYMLPIFGIAGCIANKMLCRVEKKIEKYFFIGTNEDYLEFLNRCKFINN